MGLWGYKPVTSLIGGIPLLMVRRAGVMICKGELKVWGLKAPAPPKYFEYSYLDSPSRAAGRSKGPPGSSAEIIYF